MSKICWRFQVSAGFETSTRWICYKVSPNSELFFVRGVKEGRLTHRKDRERWGRCVGLFGGMAMGRMRNAYGSLDERETTLL